MEHSNINAIVDSVIAILERYTVKDWLTILLEKKKYLNIAFTSGNNEEIISQLNEFLELYGGMGSFTDLFITNKAGHNISNEETSKVNLEFGKLRTQLYLALQEEKSRINQSTKR